MTIDARVAIVETKLDKMDSDLKEHETKDEERMSEINKKLEDLSSQLVRSKSFIGGIVFIISCLWAVVVLFKDNLFGNLFK